VLNSRQISNIFQSLLHYSFFLVFSLLNAQSFFIQEETLPIPPEFGSHQFAPDQIAVGAGGHLYFLDQTSRQIVVIAPTREVYFAGGVGNRQDAFFDPIGLAIYHLDVWLSDRSENRLLKFDSRLNFIQAEVHDPIYPEGIACDPWGNVLLYSPVTRTIARRTSVGWDPLPFVDFNLLPELANCVTDLEVAASGETALLFPCIPEVALFNRLGRLVARYPLEVAEPRFLVPLRRSWLVLDEQGNGEIVPDGIQIHLATDETLRDAVITESRLYLLGDTRVFIWRVNPSQ
jgi:hypothetical protein